MKRLNKKGFTLAEVLVASIISGLIIIALVAIWRGSAKFVQSGGQEAILQNKVARVKYLIHQDITEASWAQVRNGPAAGVDFNIIGASNLETKKSPPEKIVEDLDINRFYYCINEDTASLYRYAKTESAFTLPYEEPYSSFSNCGDTVSGWSKTKLLSDLVVDQCVSNDDTSNTVIRVVLELEKELSSSGKIIKIYLDESFRNQTSYRFLTPPGGGVKAIQDPPIIT